MSTTVVDSTTTPIAADVVANPKIVKGRFGKKVDAVTGVAVPSAKKTGKRARYDPRVMHKKIRAVVKANFPEAQIRLESCLLLQDIVLYSLDRICENAEICMAVTKSPKTLKLVTMQSAIQLYFIQCKQIYANGMSQSREVVKKYEAARAEQKARAATRKANKDNKESAPVPVAVVAPQSTSQKAGLLLPATRIKHLIRSKVANLNQISSGVDVLLTGMLEFLVIELVDLANEYVQVEKRKLITPNDIFQSLSNDADELYRLFKSVSLGHGTGHAVIPGIEPAIAKDQYQKYALLKASGHIAAIPEHVLQKEKKREEQRKKRKQATSKTEVAPAADSVETAAENVEEASEEASEEVVAPPAKKAKVTPAKATGARGKAAAAAEKAEKAVVAEKQKPATRGGAKNTGAPKVSNSLTKAAAPAKAAGARGKAAAK